MGGSGLACSAVAAAGLADPQRWKAWWDGGSCSSGVSCRIPWRWQPERLQAPLPTGNKPSWLLGPVPVSWWCDCQQRRDHLPRAFVSHLDNEGLHTLPGCCRVYALQVSVDAARDLWYLEGTKVRMALPLECSHFFSCPSHPSLPPSRGFTVPRHRDLRGKDGWREEQGLTGPKGNPAKGHLHPPARNHSFSSPCSACFWPPPCQRCWSLSLPRLTPGPRLFSHKAGGLLQRTMGRREAAKPSHTRCPDAAA